jgi:hypothetical protein
MMIERKFKAVNRKVGGITTTVLREGVNGTGVTLPYVCGFCRDSHGNPTAAFRTQKERNEHANRCPS